MMKMASFERRILHCFESDAVCLTDILVCKLMLDSWMFKGHSAQNAQGVMYEVNVLHVGLDL